MTDGGRAGLIFVDDRNGSGDAVPRKPRGPHKTFSNC